MVPQWAIRCGQSVRSWWLQLDWVISRVCPGRVPGSAGRSKQRVRVAHCAYSLHRLLAPSRPSRLRCVCCTDSNRIYCHASTRAQQQACTRTARPERRKARDNFGQLQATLAKSGRGCCRGRWSPAICKCRNSHMFRRWSCIKGLRLRGERHPGPAHTRWQACSRSSSRGGTNAPAAFALQPPACSVLCQVPFAP